MIKKRKGNDNKVQSTRNTFPSLDLWFFCELVKGIRESHTARPFHMAVLLAAAGKDEEEARAAGWEDW